MVEEPATVHDVDAVTELDIKRVKEDLRAVPRKGAAYGWLSESADWPGPGLQLHGRLVFNYLGRLEESALLNGWRRIEADLGSMCGPDSRFPYDLEVVSMVVGGRLKFEIRGKSEVLGEKKIRRLADSLQEEFDGLVLHLSSKCGSELTPSDIDYDGFDIDTLDGFLKQFDHR